MITTLQQDATIYDIFFKINEMISNLNTVSNDTFPLPQFSMSVVDDTTTNATFRPTFLSAAQSAQADDLTTASSKLTFNPFTGTLSATVMTQLSDITLKENIKVIENALDSINQLRGVSFNWIDTKKPAIGLISQDVEKIVPEVVDTNDQELKTVNYVAIEALLINAINELTERVKAIEERLKND